MGGKRRWDLVLGTCSEQLDGGVHVKSSVIVAHGVLVYLQRYPRWLVSVALNVLG